MYRDATENKNMMIYKTAPSRHVNLQNFIDETGVSAAKPLPQTHITLRESQNSDNETESSAKTAQAGHHSL